MGVLIEKIKRVCDRLYCRTNWCIDRVYYPAAEF